jgi:hypothetical protein
LCSCCFNPWFANTNLAFIDKIYRDWELARSTNKFSGASASTVLRPWGVSVGTVLNTISPCVKYAPTNAANRVAPPPSKSTDLKGYQMAVNEAAKAKADAALAAKQFGATDAQVDETKKAIAAINKEIGLDLADAA